MHSMLFHNYQSYNVHRMHKMRDATIQHAFGSIRILFFWSQFCLNKLVKK